MKEPIKRHCPECHQVLYNRRLDRCGFCAAPISEVLRFTPEEIAEIEKMESEVVLQRKIHDAAQWAQPLGQSDSSTGFIGSGG